MFPLVVCGGDGGKTLPRIPDSRLIGMQVGAHSKCSSLGKSAGGNVAVRMPQPVLLSIVFFSSCLASASSEIVLLEEDFASYSSGAFFSVVGAHAEYHYLPETAPKGAWAVSAYTSDPLSQLAWKVFDHEGIRVMAQTYTNKRKDTHPLLVAGNWFWTDYAVTVRFAPEVQGGRSGLVFRRKNDRCYYFFGFENDRCVLLCVRHGTEFRKPAERVLAEKRVAYNLCEYVTARVVINGTHIYAAVNDETVADLDDGEFTQGGIGLLADVPTRYSEVLVTTTPETYEQIQTAIARCAGEEQSLQAANPKPVVVKKMSTVGFGAGRNLRFGDLDGDKRIDILIGQVRHHGPKDANSELSCLTAITIDGDILWQVGEPDLWKYGLTNDVAFQIHDIDGDGKTEVVYCMNQEIIIADGATGAIKKKKPNPESPANTKPPHNRFPRILGDSLFFCDMQGVGRPSTIVLKDRYSSFWVLNENLEVLSWAQCNTGHYPFAADIDNDGKDELVMGYSLFDDDGRLLWTLDEKLKDHADGVAIVRLSREPDAEFRIVCAASDEGMVWLDCHGNILKHEHLGHLQNPATADFRPDLPGLETVTVNYWGDQGIIHFFDANGEVYHDFEPFQHGSLCLPINWTGSRGEFVVLSANCDDGGMFDGWGRRVVRFPADGHPDMCYAVLDVLGDCRDEVIVWDPYELWIYTQDDNPRDGELYKPVRNPLYNYSNYQAIVSLAAESGRVSVP